MLLAMGRSDMSSLKSIAPESRTEKASFTASLLKVFNSRKQVSGHGATTRFGTARSVARFSLILFSFSRVAVLYYGSPASYSLEKVSIAVTKLSFHLDETRSRKLSFHLPFNFKAYEDAGWVACSSSRG